MYIVQYPRRTSWLSLWLGLAVSIFSLVLSTIQFRKNGVLALARVRVSTQYFPVLDCVSYSCTRKRSWLSLWLGLAVRVRIFLFWSVYRTVRKKDVLALARVRVSSQYFSVLDRVSYSCARTRSWLSLWLWLAVSIFQFWIVYRTVRKIDVLALDSVMVSSQYFTVLDRVSYSCTIKRSWLSLWLGLAVSIFQFWIIHRTVRKKNTMAPVIVRVIREYFAVGIVYHTITQEGCPGSC